MLSMTPLRLNLNLSLTSDMFIQHYMDAGHTLVFLVALIELSSIGKKKNLVSELNLSFDFKQ